jgi:hypothetical protein
VIVKELFAKLGLDVDEASFSVGKQALAVLKDGMIALGATATGAALALAGIVKKTADAAAAAGKTAAMVGMSTDAWQELQFAAGGSADALQTGLVRLSRSMLAANMGNYDLKQSFDKLGISVGSFGGKLPDTDEALGKIAAKFAAMPNDANKTALAVKLFGRGGAELIPFLNKGRDGIAELRAEAQRLGLVIDQKTIASAKKFNKALHEVEGAGRGLAYAIGGPLIESVTPVLKAMTDWIAKNREFIAQSIHTAVRAVAAAAKALWVVLGPVVKLLGSLLTNTTLLNVALVVLGGYLTMLASQQLLVLITAIRTAVFWFGALQGSALSAAAAAISAWLAAAAPIAAIIAMGALIFLIFEDLWTYLQGGDSLAGRFADALWKYIPAAWDKVIGYFTDKWNEFAAWVTNSTLGKWFNGLLDKINTVMGGSAASNSGGPAGAFDDYGAMFGAGAQGPSASVSASPGQGNMQSVSQSFAPQVNVTPAPGADSQRVGADVANAIDREKTRWLREAAAAVQSG